jgi:uncharacterized membrane protein YciS (DUF1049 family)
MKKIIIRTLSAALFTLCFTLMITPDVHAYLDPAATSYIVQVIAGVVITAGVTIGIFWKKIRLFFRNQKMKRLEAKLNRQAQTEENK